MERYAQMVLELEQAVRMKEARELEKKPSAGSKPSNQNQVVMGGQVINEDDFADENLC